ncbi:MAG: hypothetical protein ABWW70_06370 [Thermoproteota archaeon]
MFTRRVVEKRLKRFLLEEARKAKLDLQEIAEWLQFSAGISARPDWGDIERKILEAEEISAQELAAFLLEEGVRVDEEKWIEIVKSSYKGTKVPRM